MDLGQGYPILQHHLRLNLLAPSPGIGCVYSLHIIHPLKMKEGGGGGREWEEEEGREWRGAGGAGRRGREEGEGREGREGAVTTGVFHQSITTSVLQGLLYFTDDQQRIMLTYCTLYS